MDITSFKLIWSLVLYFILGWLFWFFVDISYKQRVLGFWNVRCDNGREYNHSLLLKLSNVFNVIMGVNIIIHYFLNIVLIIVFFFVSLALTHHLKMVKRNVRYALLTTWFTLFSLIQFPLLGHLNIHLISIGRLYVESNYAKVRQKRDSHHIFSKDLNIVDLWVISLIFFSSPILASNMKL